MPVPGCDKEKSREIHAKGEGVKCLLMIADGLLCEVTDSFTKRMELLDG